MTDLISQNSGIFHTYQIKYPSAITFPSKQTYQSDVLTYRLICYLSGVQK